MSRAHKFVELITVLLFNICGFIPKIDEKLTKLADRDIVKLYTQLKLLKYESEQKSLCAISCNYVNHRRSQGVHWVHVYPQSGEKNGAKFTGESCKCTHSRECTP